MVLLITGNPGSGKTTLIRKVVERLPLSLAAGFYTEEIRQGGARKGFGLVSLSGKRGVLAHVDIRGPRRVGRYGVDVQGFERFIEGIPFDEAELAVVDEIGKMECLSARFREMIRELLQSGRPLLATIARRGTPFIEGLKKAPGARLLELTERNRDTLVDEVFALLEGDNRR
jgi:nucleoside-triphosphatase